MVNHMVVNVAAYAFSQWIVSRSCSSEPCTSYSGPKLNPTISPDAKDTGATLEIQYLQGYVSGPIWWEDLILGPYTLSSQAFGTIYIYSC